MQTNNRLFDDIAKMASGALHTLGGLREEVETRVRERIERLAVDMDLVTREEFEAARAMAAKAREEQEALAARLAKVEAGLAGLKASGGAGGGKEQKEAAAAAAPSAQPKARRPVGTRKPRPAAAKKTAAAGSTADEPAAEPDVDAGAP